MIERANTFHKNDDFSKALAKQDGKIKGLTDQIDALSVHLSRIPKNMNPTSIFLQMQKIEEMKTKVQQERDEILSKEGAQELPASWTDYENYLKMVDEMLPVSSTPELRTKIMRLLVHQVELFPDRILLYYYVGRGQLKQLAEYREEKLKLLRPMGTIENAEMGKVTTLNNKEKPDLKFRSDPVRITLTNGWGARIRT